MNTSLEEMLKKIPTDTPEQKRNAMKEIMQEIILCGLSRANFFHKAAFDGGTALRIFHGLDRFSEDLDFSLLNPDPDFDLSVFFPLLKKEVQAYGLNLDISEKEKTKESDIKSAFLKGNTREHILLFFPDSAPLGGIVPGEIVKIRLEIDVNPPTGAHYEHRFQLLPAPYEVQLFDMPSLFAGKIHAVICRAWKHRVKGRDLYDYVFYLSRKTKVNLPHLQARLEDSGVWKKGETLDIGGLRALLSDRFGQIDFLAAKADVRSFLSDPRSLEVWSPDFFRQITSDLEAD